MDTGSVRDMLRNEEKEMDLNAAPDWKATAGFDDLSPPRLMNSYSSPPFGQTDSFRSMDMHAGMEENALNQRTVWRGGMVPPSVPGMAGGGIHSYDHVGGNWGGLPMDDGLYHGMGSMQLNPKQAHDSVYRPQKQGFAKLQPKNLQDAVHVVAAPRSSSAAPPTAPGGWLEPNYHFVSNSRPVALFQALQAYLEGKSIDFTVKPAKFKCKCVTYPDGSRLPFFVRIFSTAVPEQYAVEFQRRSGDIIRFSEIYRDAKCVLSQDGHVVCEGPPSPVFVPFEAPPLDLDEETMVTAEDTEETLNCLVSMAGSSFADVKSQAVQALSQLTLSKDTQGIMIQGSAFELMVDSLSSNHEDIHRCAATGLANLVEGRADAAKSLQSKNAVPAFLALSRSDCTEVVRESTRALANMGAMLKSTLAGDPPVPGLRESINQLVHSGDSKTRAYATALQSSVKT
mmetsp:Transcript_24809/g.27471  ORF Transcript_24809/g.27471 Transcript_24809/m.27471 type:complete len:454 (+) Transcript_24809:139-1500(+)|eukprot:CAMPEP_0205822982 /NCGR_PEP_ID=MMETSP0206-20130828/14566_1 /ASSEMBLY_ACC=CAM_ASM_000279 /TAXON_ID=36767 /ORGANISM="Euplotes focardii, Strain TN1" /LENGTH=453 /DNA_ID=CAMNT_0053119715 /DNA_START=139 /DNA_END=1500 /DNA_ORIENTATION=-